MERVFRSTIVVLSVVLLAWIAPMQAMGADTKECSGGACSGGTRLDNDQSQLEDNIEAAPPSPTMHYFTSHTLPGDYVAAGVGMRNKGKGKIKIKGVKGDVEQAFLYWAIVNTSETAAMSAGVFDGNPISGNLVGTGGDPCWGGGSTYSYRADVTEHVTGNGTYELSGFASGITDGSSPWENYGLPLNEGASLVVIYRNGSKVQTIVLYEGSQLFYGSEAFSFDMTGFTAGSKVKKAKLTAIIADGQLGNETTPVPDIDKEYIAVNGQVVGKGINGRDGWKLPQLWDTLTYNVKKLVPAGSKKITVSNTGYDTAESSDCLVWVAAVFSVSTEDTDNDGLPDDWEINGYDHDGDGEVDVDLPSMGADPNKKDLFIEVDYMETTDHTHRPIQAGIDLITASFAAATVKNPDRSTGVTLHVDVDDVLAHDSNLDLWTEFDALKEANFDEARLPIFHYCIFGHNYNGGSSSGISKGIPGSDFLVTLGSWTNNVGTTQEQAGTFMHELGHNLGLRHGGNNHVNYKPNYVSIMNYYFQTRGLMINGVEGNFDYSRYKNKTLKESRLVEKTGIGEPINYGTRFHDSGCTQRASNDSRPIDWNWNSQIDKGKQSVDTNCNGSSETMKGHIDWEGLILDGRALGVSSPRAYIGIDEDNGAALEDFMKELTVEEDSEIPPSSPSWGTIDTTAAGVSQLSWTPVGLQIIAYYNVYHRNSAGVDTLIDSIQADSEMELYGTGVYSLDIQDAPLGDYIITAVDHYGNESIR